MCKIEKITIDLVNGNPQHIDTMPRIEKSTVLLPGHLQNRISELESELLVTKFRLSERQQVLDAIPGCPLHGKNCVPHALDWIRERINQTVIDPNNKKLKTGSKPATKKQFHKGDVQYIAETYQVPMGVIRKIMREKGKDGRYARNRNIIYSALCELGYTMQNN